MIVLGLGILRLMSAVLLFYYSMSYSVVNSLIEERARWEQSKHDCYDISSSKGLGPLLSKDSWDQPLHSSRLGFSLLAGRW